MRALLLALFALPAAVAAQPALDPLPVTFLPGGAGSEGCYAQWSTRSAVHAYSAPTVASRRLRTVDGQRRVDANDYSESLTAVLQPGLVRATRLVEVRGARLGSPRDRTLQLGAGDELEILAEGPEEAVYFTLDGAVYNGFVSGYYGGGGLEVVRRPVTELWVRLVDYGEGRPASWLNTAQAGMAVREPFCE